MGVSLKLVVSIAVAACALVSFAYAVEKLGPEPEHLPGVYDHKIVPNPILGMRG
ncbi:MAG TPA: hypothetical protein VKF40_30975 [Burkholderiales bacterium]|nr:hypothetical protein [Burkholderiales bacterium]